MTKHDNRSNRRVLHFLKKSTISLSPKLKYAASQIILFKRLDFSSLQLNWFAQCSLKFVYFGLTRLMHFISDRPNTDKSSKINSHRGSILQVLYESGDFLRMFEIIKRK